MKRAFLVALGLCVTNVFTACRIEPVDPPDPTPTPTPVPTPTPTPSPAPIPTQSPSPTSARSAETEKETPLDSALAQRVAETNADIVLASAKDALSKGEALQNALAELAAAPHSERALAEARGALATARGAWRQVEVAVFYTDDDAPMEILAVPDPDDSSGMSQEPRGFTAIAALLDVASNANRPSSDDKTAEKAPDVIVTQAVLGQAVDLLSELRRFADAWERNAPTNFRNRYFEISPSESVRRIFQGHVTYIGAVLPKHGEGESGDSSLLNATDDVFASLHGLRTLYLGTFQSSSGRLISGPGMRNLIEQVDREAAQRIDDAFLRSMELSTNGGSSGSITLEESLVALKDEWASAAGQFHLIVEEPDR